MNIDRAISQRASEAYADTTIRQPPPTVGAPAPHGSHSVAQPHAVGAGATIKLSPQAQLYAQALAAAQATPDVRADRVAAIQARLAGGDESVDVTALAGKLLGQVDH